MNQSKYEPMEWERFYQPSRSVCESCKIWIGGSDVPYTLLITGEYFCTHCWEIKKKFEDDGLFKRLREDQNVT